MDRVERLLIVEGYDGLRAIRLMPAVCSACRDRRCTPRCRSSDSRDEATLRTPSVHSLTLPSGSGLRCLLPFPKAGVA